MKAILALLLITTTLYADELRGRVIAVTDGDTLTVLDANGTQRKIRLNGIDAPELSQPFGEQSKQNLTALTLNKDAVVIWSKTDRYGRLVGTVTQGALDTGLLQLRDGFAWYFRQYESDVPPVERVIYDAAEQAARNQARGLWSQPSPQPPWEYRHPEQTVPPTTSAPAISGSALPSVPPPQARKQPARTYIRGPRGGCYYLSGNRKVYVDHGLCRG